MTKFLPFLDERNVSRECRTGRADITSRRLALAETAQNGMDTRCQPLENLRAFTPVFLDHSWITFSTSAPLTIIQSSTRSGRAHDRPWVIRKRGVSREKRQY